MKIHEYQAKELFAAASLPVLRGITATTPAEALKAAHEIGLPVVVKAQVLVGGRGKAGGVKIARSFEEVTDAACRILGLNIKGLPVRKVLVTRAIDYDSELYLGFIIDRRTQKPVMMASAAGGVEIEEVARQTPDKIATFQVDPASGYSGFIGNRIAVALKLKGDEIKQCGALVKSLYEAFVAKDMSLLEINPLVVTKAGKLVCLDAKMNFDDNALYRHKDIAALRDLAEEDPAEVEASKHELSYIKLDGSIGCMVNGAGLAMATMDIIKLTGGEPANFLDVGGGASKEKVTEAFKLILSDKHVEGILVNIFGGIMKCDIIADGIVAAAKEVHLSKPLVVRLEGTNVEKGKEILAKSGLPIVSGNDLADAAEKIVKAVESAR